MLATFFRARQRHNDLYDFPGGIHPPEMKTLSNGTPIQPGPLPAQLILPLNMHLGAPAKPLVSPGDKVLKGQLIAEPGGAVSAAVHAPTSGTITAIGQRPVQHPSGLQAPCLILEPDGEERWAERLPLTDYASQSPEELVAHIRQAGIAGLGGAGFPTSVKVNLGDHQRVDELIINGVECEPYITADDRLMREHADEIVTGIQIFQYLLNPRRTLLGIEDNKPEAIAAMAAACEGSDIELKVVPTKYPSGGEKQLIQLLTGKEVRSGSLPADVGVVCQNVATAQAVKRAVIDGEPLLSRVTTLSGDALSRPGNYQVLLGTPVQDLLQHAGVHSEQLEKLVMGGPMMGFTIHNAQVPVVKTSNCVIVGSHSTFPEPPAEQACIRCGACAEVCPAGLLPQQLYWYAKHDELERAQQHHLMDCIECGACAYVCPSHIPLVQYYRYAKGEVRIQAAEQAKADRARQRFEARQARIEQEQAEKEARRQARLEANRKKKTAPSAPSADLTALKDASLNASKAYKAAVKAAKAAEAEGADNAASLKTEADRLKTLADQAKAAVRDAQQASPAAPASGAIDQLAALKKQVGDASSAYKAAVKAHKTAEQEGANNVAELKAQADQLKAEADRLKAALRDAKASAAVPAPPHAAAPAEDGLAALKKQVGEASSAYKAAVKAHKTAEQEGADNVAELKAQADQLKAEADRLKAALRDAKASAPPPVAGPAAQATPSPVSDTAETAISDKAAKRQKRMKALKTAYNMAHKQYKDAHAALERAERSHSEQDDQEQQLAAMRAKVDKLKAKADVARDALDALVEEAKADILAHTGKDLKTLKLDTVRADNALREKQDQLEACRDSASEDTLETLSSEIKALEQAAHLARLALEQAIKEQGLSDA